MIVLYKIQQSPRRRHHDVDRLFVQGPQLLLIVLSTHQGDHVQIRVLGQVNSVVGDLYRQLPRRRDDQRPWLGQVTLFGLRIVLQVIDDGNQEGGRLACAGLRLAHHVVAFQGVHEAAGLDGRAVLESKIGNGLVQGFHQMEGGKGCFRI